MSKSVNHVVIVGNLGKDAETKFTPSGVAKTAFTVATSRSWKKGDEWQEETTWHNVVLWRNETLGAMLLKGARVYVDGRIETRSYEGRDGQKKYITEIVAENVIPCGGAGERGARPARSNDWDAKDGMRSPIERKQQPVTTADGITDDDVPF
jgi:single-strand DNA-binding protein